MAEAFEFATASRIAFGCGVRREVAPAVSALGARVLLVTGRSRARVAWLEDDLRPRGLDLIPVAIDGEPSVAVVEAAVLLAREERVQVVVAVGGGSVLDAAKAVAGLVGNPGAPLDYLELVGQGRALPGPGLPFVAVPTTAGTGSEVTRNAVLTAQGVKVSLRSAHLLARAAFVDPELTVSMPQGVTAASGMDAACQVIEPFVSVGANLLTDGFC